MKKFLLSALVLVIFTVYAIELRSGRTNKASVAVRASKPDNPFPSSATTPASTNTYSGKYKDGTYTGNVTDAFYGNIQVQVAVSGGKIADVTFLQYPNDRETSVMINEQAMPLLKQEAIQAQSAQVDGVSGATQTSIAFIKSLGSALQKAI